MNDPGFVVDYLKENWEVFALIALIAVNFYRTNVLHKVIYNGSGEMQLVTKRDNIQGLANASEWKKKLYHEDGTLHYMTKKDCEKVMSDIVGDAKKTSESLNNCNITVAKLVTLVEVLVNGRK